MPANLNSTALGEFLELKIAMHRVEELVEASMVLVLHESAGPRGGFHSGSPMLPASGIGETLGN